MFTQKVNAIEKLQAHLAYPVPGYFAVEACQKCGVNCINFIKQRNADAMVEKQFEEKRR